MVYNELAKEFFGLANTFLNAKSLDEKQRITERMAVVASEQIAVAEKYPNDPIAFAALSDTCKTAIWLERNTAYARGDTNAPEQRAIGQLLRDHLPREDLWVACKWISGGFNADCEMFLRRVLNESPHRNVRGHACLLLARFLYARSQRLQLLASRPDRARRYDSLFGKPFIDALKRRKPAEAAAEYEALFERAAREFGDLMWSEEPTIAKQVAVELNEIRRITVGKPALEIEGEDQHGVPFKLSDYRGKVVLLYFWQHG